MPQRTTAQRGYGRQHQLERLAYVAIYRPGQPCAIGGEPLWQPPRLLDLAHDHTNGGYLGLACRHHNRTDGARRAGRLTATRWTWGPGRSRIPRVQPGRRW